MASNWKNRKGRRKHQETGNSQAQQKAELEDETQGRFWKVIEIAAGIIFAVMSGVFGTLGSSTLCILFGCASIFFALALVANQIVGILGKPKLIWGVFGGLASILLTTACFWIFSIQSTISAKSLSGLLLPSNDFLPEGNISSGSYVLACGKNYLVTGVFSNGKTITLIRFHDKDLLTLGFGKDGAHVTGELFGKNGNVVAVLDKNKFKINPLNYFSSEHPDKSTLIVRDQQNVEVLNVRFAATNFIRFSGQIRMPDSTEIIITPTNVAYGRYSFSGTMWAGFGALLNVQENGSIGVGAP